MIKRVGAYREGLGEKGESAGNRAPEHRSRARGEGRGGSANTAPHGRWVRTATPLPAG